jgi:hypothetical protein
MGGHNLSFSLVTVNYLFCSVFWQFVLLERRPLLHPATARTRKRFLPIAGDQNLCTPLAGHAASESTRDRRLEQAVEVTLAANLNIGLQKVNPIV